jgi:phosphate butyryltransferase
VEAGGRDFEIIDVDDEDECVWRACELIRQKEVDMIMKGQLPTPLFLRAILDKEKGLRAGRTLSHCAVLEVDSYQKLLLVTDGGMCVRPDLVTKVDIVRNALDLAKSLRIDEPKVAILASVEKVDPKLQETVDARKIKEMWEAGEFPGAIVDGPLALDLAVSQEAALRKGIDSPIAGDADILVVPDVPTGNIFAKGLIYLGGARASGLVLGAKCPVVLLSRADTAATKLHSIALGAVHSQ